MEPLVRLLLLALAVLLSACSREAAPPARDAGSATPAVQPAYAPPPALAAEDPDAAVPGGTDPGGQGWPPAMSTGPDSDCTASVTSQFSGKGAPLRRGMAALGTQLGTKDDFLPVLYFNDEGGARRCRGGDGSMVVAVWTGHAWSTRP